MSPAFSGRLRAHHFWPLLVALLVAAGVVQAAFSMRLRGTIAARFAQLGGRLIYSARVRVNGAPARLSALGFERALSAVAGDLATLLRSPELARADGALVTHRQEGRDQHLLLLPGGDAGRCTLLLVEPESGTPPASPPPPPPGGAPYPTARVTFWAGNERTRMLLVVAECDDAPEVAQAAITARLQREGWTPLPGGNGTLTCFGREGAACVARVAPPDAPGAPTRITLLRQQAATL